MSDVGWRAKFRCPMFMAGARLPRRKSFRLAVRCDTVAQIKWAWLSRARVAESRFSGPRLDSCAAALRGWGRSWHRLYNV